MIDIRYTIALFGGGLFILLEGFKTKGYDSLWQINVAIGLSTIILGIVLIGINRMQKSNLERQSRHPVD